MTEIYVDSKILALRALHNDFLARDFSEFSIRDRLAVQAETILSGHKAGNIAITFHLGSWCPRFIGVDSKAIMDSCLSRHEAQETIAREYGYRDWQEVEKLQGMMLDEEFESAVDSVVNGKLSRLENQISKNSELVTQRSQYGHRATLLHYIGANGVESYRQVTPLNAPEITRCLIDAGADANSSARMYGGSTVLDLVLSSAHPQNAGVASMIVDELKGEGAR